MVASWVVEVFKFIVIIISNANRNLHLAFAAVVVRANINVDCFTVRKEATIFSQYKRDWLRIWLLFTNTLAGNFYEIF